MLPRIYLDNAATSWPKPESVYVAVDEYQRNSGAPAGRSPYAEALDVTRRVEGVRAVCARLLGVRKPAQLVFTAGGTDGLNLAIHGLLRPGDRVVTSAAEHNSVLRPLAEWERRGEIEVARIDCDATGLVDVEELRRALEPRTRLVALSHASNVTGSVQPIGEIAAIARQAGALLLLDAAQTAGHLPIDVEELGVDLLATSGHKGLLGPLGTGLLYLRPGLENDLACTRQGGTGTRSDDDRQPRTMPDKYESGNLNVPGILGLGAGVEYLLGKGVAALERQVLAHTARLLAGLSEIDAVRLHGRVGTTNRLGVVSLTIEGYDPQEIATVLDTSFRIQVRPGLHCAPHMHRALGTLQRGGTVRLSLGHFTTGEQIDAALSAIRELVASA
jgi:cysteine desulfurase / selenocysteine lyase